MTNTYTQEQGMRDKVGTRHALSLRLHIQPIRPTLFENKNKIHNLPTNHQHPHLPMPRCPISMPQTQTIVHHYRR